MEAKHEHLHIFVNNKKFHEGIAPKMSVNAIAALIGLTAENSVVRKQVDGKAGPPLSGEIEIKDGEHFVVTRKHVEGGHDEIGARIAGELKKLDEGGQRTTLIDSPRAVVYHDLLCANPSAPVAATDVLVLVPPGYAATALDYAFLPVGSPLIGRVLGAPQQQLSAGGKVWQQISYHPHANGGGPPWNHARHGFHTYLDELLTWLANVR